MKLNIPHKLFAVACPWVCFFGSLIFASPLYAQENGLTFPGFGFSQGAISIRPDPEDLWIGQVNYASFLTIEFPSKAYYWGDSTGFGWGYSSILSEFVGKEQTLSDPTGIANPYSSKTIDLESRVRMYSLSVNLNLFYTFNRKGRHPLRFFVAPGYGVSSLRGELFLTHAPDRTPECAQAVDDARGDAPKNSTKQESLIRLHCESIHFKARNSTTKTLYYGARWKVFDYNGVQAHLSVTRDQPLEVKSSSYILRYEEAYRFGFFIQAGRR